MSKKIGMGLLFIGFCLLLCGCLLCKHVPDGYQFALPAGNLSETYPQAISTVKRLAEVIARSTISARKQGVLLQGVRNEINLTLYAVDADYLSVCHETLQAGRFIGEGDIKSKRSVIVIDETIAYRLYTGGEAIGKTLNIDGTDWTIIGIIDNSLRYGEADAGVAYVPITAANTLSMDTLEIRLTGSNGNGWSTIVETNLRQWRMDGTAHNLTQEKYAAMIPMHWAVTIFSLLLTLWISQRAFRFGTMTFRIYKEKLRTHYIRELVLWLTGKVLLLLLLALSVACLTMLTLYLGTSPALVFTDWIPENPVSIASYTQRFWSIHQNNAQAIHCFTREKSMVMLAAWLIRWGTMAMLGGSLIRKMKWRKIK